MHGTDKRHDEASSRGAGSSSPEDPPRGDRLRVLKALGLSDALRFWRASRSCTPFRDHWLPFLADYARTFALPRASVDLLMKPLNEFLVIGLPVSERVALLRTHYQLLAEHASPEVLRSLWSGGEFESGRISGRTGTYRLQLCSTSRYLTRKEGEITVALCGGEDGFPLAKLTLLLARTQRSGSGVMLGGIQGPRAHSAKQLIVNATRDMYGLRPRDAVLVAGFAIARSLDASMAWAVPGSMHVHNAREERQQKKLFADYDAIWVERGAQRNWPFGWIFDVPHAPSLTGRCANGRRRDELKSTIWELAQRGFLGAAGDLPRSAHATNQLSA